MLKMRIHQHHSNYVTAGQASKLHLRKPVRCRTGGILDDVDEILEFLCTHTTLVIMCPLVKLMLGNRETLMIGTLPFRQETLCYGLINCPHSQIRRNLCSIWQSIHNTLQCCLVSDDVRIASCWICSSH